MGFDSGFDSKVARFMMHSAQYLLDMTIDGHTSTVPREPAAAPGAQARHANANGNANAAPSPTGQAHHTN
ncbi:hypothetical protein [Paraburkholderia acidisoli]|uniref:Uncharacterized protein n=1 Tax=Paraburkholderia acidisoli TaxID=2571748 RepID=A0A7Z2JI44_9BURK|nr:hypothetical protein [Paraburkholderia acidisoli]QGZ65301.1 hypothetical protein FAZ98_26390 [Paraburkholderia acidisoli]